MKKLWALLLTLALVVGVVSPITIVYAETNGVVMTVNGEEYTDHGTGWSAAVKLAESGTDVTVKLFADWVADSSTGFVCPDGGTKDGSLHVGGGKVTLDLNGYTLDRNANKDADTYSSGVLYIEDCTFTIDDTSAEKDGKITGGYSRLGGGIVGDDIKLTLNGGNISGNKAKEYGGGVYLSDYEFTMNGGSITDNYATYGGAIYASFADVTMNGGVIARNYVEGMGGAVYLFAGDFFYEFNMYDGVIEENYALYDGGAAYMRHSTAFIMHGGIVRNNRAKQNGGALATEPPGGQDVGYNKIIVKGGTFTGNVAELGNGGAIRWDSQYRLYLSNCTITNNSAPNGRGGGVYIDTLYSDGIAFGGTVNITGNTAVTDRLDNTSNVYISTEDLSQFRHDYDDFGALNTDSKIGLTIGVVDVSTKTKLNDGDNFSDDVISCFILDDPHYTMVKEKRSNGNYDFYIEENPSYIPHVPCMTVETKAYGKVNFGSLQRGWEYAVEQAKNNDVIVTLYANWLSANGKYSYNDESTYDGTLHVPRSCKNNITIDLNGYSIDRNLEFRNVTYLHNGCVFSVDCEGSLTITDSSEAQTGTITGGKNEWLYSPVQLNACGGAFNVEYGTLYIKGGNITGNSATYGGAIYINDLDDAAVYILGGKIYGNTAKSEGGAIYANNGYLYVDGGEITGNTAKYGGGIYWDSFNEAYLTGGKIYGNTATENGGGFYIASFSSVYFGGDIQILENTKGNVYVYDSSSSRIYNACGQDGSPNEPLRDGAYISITSSRINDLLSGEDSCFNVGDFEYFHSDSSSYFIRSVYNPDSKTHTYELYINEWAHKDARYPRVKSVSVKDSDLLKNVIFDYDAQIITLVADNTKKNFFKYSILDNLIHLTYDKDIYYLYDVDAVFDLRNTTKYKIVSDNGTYVMCTVNVVPEGGEWASEQEPYEPYKMFVSHGESGKGFTDLGEGWVYAVDQSRTRPVTIKLFEDWIAQGTGFEYSDYTDDGRLYLDGLTMNLTIDLNGHTISRNLTSATSDGHVLYMNAEGSVTITDSSDSKTGTITGGNTTGNGGAIYVDYGELHINGGNIVNNHAEEDGGAIYCDDLDDAYVFINGGKISDNTAGVDGGAVFVYNGYLYMDGGELSGNTAQRGGAVFWESRNSAYFTGGKITGNSASGYGGGTFIDDYGTIYLGGDIVIDGNTANSAVESYNMYLAEFGVNLNNARGQVEGVPNKPLTEDAKIGISINGSGDGVYRCLSEDGSMFNQSDYRCFYSDMSSYYIRAQYNPSDEDHMYSMYLTTATRYDAKFPEIESVAVKNSELLQSAVIDTETQIITLTAYANKRDVLKDIDLDSLISCSFSEDVSSTTMTTLQDFTSPVECRIMSDNGIYVTCIVVVEWVCESHTDADNDYVCDECEENIYADVAIIDYNAETREAAVFVAKPGKYSLIFADYEDTRLANVDIVEYDFVEGINVVPQEVINFTLTSGDKVLLWYDMINLVPVCEALTIK